MRRIKDSRENETEKNVRDAFEKFSRGKHNRAAIKEYEADLDENVRVVLADIINETFEPQGYKEKVIHEKKIRHLAKAPIRDHHTETAAMLPYEQQVYDYVSWRAPAVIPGMGTHAMFRFIRNTLFNSTQSEVMYNLTMDIHHYFPTMDHAIIKQKIDNSFKKGKLRTFIYKVIDSYISGIPLGIKLAQLLGMLCLADFDRKAERLDIAKDPERLAYWTDRYVNEIIGTASEKNKYILDMGATAMAERFVQFAQKGLPHYYRFVDNLLVLHEDKAFLRIVRELFIMHLTRDYHFVLNKDHNVRPTWMGIRLCGYVFYHDRVLSSKANKQKLARNVKRLQKKGLDEEAIRIKLASQFGYIKHTNCINFITQIKMEKSLGKIINKRRIKSPFADLSPDCKKPFSHIVNKRDCSGGGEIKIYLLDYIIQESKIDKKKITVTVPDSDGNNQDITKTVAEKVLAIKYKIIVRTFPVGDDEQYIFEKKKDNKGVATDEDAYFYSFTGSRILIEQALKDFSPADLPCPTIIQELEGKDGKSYYKFT